MPHGEKCSSNPRQLEPFYGSAEGAQLSLEVIKMNLLQQLPQKVVTQHIRGTIDFLRPYSMPFVFEYNYLVPQFKSFQLVNIHKKIVTITFKLYIYLFMMRMINSLLLLYHYF